MKKAMKQRAVFQEERTEILINGKNTMAVSNVNEFKSHGSSAFHRVFIATGRAETTVTAERDKLKIAAMITAIHGTAEGGVTTMDHFVHVFYDGITWMQCINHFFIMVCKNLLKDVHKTIMQEKARKRNPTPQD